MSMHSQPQPRDGFEEVAFYGINSSGELPPDKAASEHAAQYYRAYVHSTEEGFYVFADLRLEEFMNSKSIKEWLNTPIEVHIERWKKQLDKK